MQKSFQLIEAVLTAAFEKAGGTFLRFARCYSALDSVRLIFVSLYLKHCRGQTPAFLPTAD